MPCVPGGIMVSGTLAGAKKVVLMEGPGSVWKWRGALGPRGERVLPNSERREDRAAKEAMWIEKG